MLTIETIFTALISLALLFSVIIFLMNLLRINDGFNFFTTSITGVFIFTYVSLTVYLMGYIVDELGLSGNRATMIMYLIIVVLLVLSTVLSWRTRKYMKETGAQCRR